MATISLTSILTDFTQADYDEISGDLILQLPTGLSSDELIVNSLLLKLETSANNKRGSVNSVISEQSVIPIASIITRRNADNTLSENQIEKKVNISIWYKEPDFNTLTPVNNND